MNPDVTPGPEQLPLFVNVAVSQRVRRAGEAALGMAETVGVGPGLEDVAAEGKPVDDRRAEPGAVQVLVQPEKLSLEAIAALFISSL